MFLGLYAVLKSDKVIDHPIMGQMSCSSLYQGYRNCIEYMDASKESYMQCDMFYDLAMQCYKVKNEAAFYDYLDERISERIKLIKFLRQNDSKIPELQEKYMNNTFNLFNVVDQQQQPENARVASIVNQQQNENKRFL